MVAVYDNTQISLYLDGTLRTTNTFTFNTGTTVPDKAMAFGARSFDSTVTDFYGGSLDEVRIYNYALSGNEVAQLYTIPEPATILLFSLSGLILRKKH